MTGLVSSTSPQRPARICGLLYLYIIAAETFAEIFVRKTILHFQPIVRTGRSSVAGVDHALLALLVAALALSLWVRKVGVAAP